MSASLRVSCCAASVALLACGILQSKSWAQSPRVERGRALFVKVWEPTHEAAPKPDGLGPLFNERSCVACHFQAGIGGAGPADKNIDLITPRLPESKEKRDALVANLPALHVGFRTASSVVLHRFSVDAKPYADFRQRMLGISPYIHHDPTRQAIAVRAILRKQGDGPVRLLKVDGVKLSLSRRNTTPLFGLGQIASIPKETLEAVVERQPQENPNVSGRLVGRFGWRGQVGDLGSFVRSACAVELGLKVTTNDQAANPLDPPGVIPAPNPFDAPNVPAPSPPPVREVDLTHEQCDDLIAFVEELPAPRQIRPSEYPHAGHIKNGERLFENAGCATCHRPTLGKVSGLYSDLLLHDMGSALRDPAPAPERLAAQSPAGYYNHGPIVSFELVSEERYREWKTPPLWGLRDSGPYLHDGRASTLEEAIVAHGGEAASSADRYLALPPLQRLNVIAFLETLAGPSDLNQQARN